MRGEAHSGWLPGHCWCKTALAAETGETAGCLAAMGRMCLPPREVTEACDEEMLEKGLDGDPALGAEHMIGLAPTLAGLLP